MLRPSKTRRWIRAIISLTFLCIGHSLGLNAAKSAINNQMGCAGDASPDAIVMVFHHILGHLQQVMDAAKVTPEPQQEAHGRVSELSDSAPEPDPRGEYVAKITSAINDKNWKEAEEIVDGMLSDKVYLHTGYVDEVHGAITRVWDMVFNTGDQFEIDASIDTISILRKKVDALLSPQAQAEIMANEQEALQLASEEHDNSARFIQHMKSQLDQWGYEIKDIRGDGNCGFYSILQCLFPKRDFSKVRKYSNEWYLAAMLRLRIAKKSKLHQLAEMTETAAGTEEKQMGVDALPYVARHYEKNVVMVNSVEQKVMVYYPNDGPKEIQLDSLHGVENPIVLLNVPGHWQAIVKTTPGYKH